VSLARQLGEAAVALDWEREPARSRAVAIATCSRLEEGAKVWMEGTTLVGLEKGRVVRALAAWGWPFWPRRSAPVDQIRFVPPTRTVGVVG
jgi:hypothetical protein